LNVLQDDGDMRLEFGVRGLRTVVDEGLPHKSAPYMVQRVLVRAMKHAPGVVRHGFNATRARKFDALKTFSRRGK